MEPHNENIAEEFSRPDRKVRELARTEPDPKELAGRIAGTAAETAELFRAEHVPLT
jgi:hypothetical protein